MHRPKVRAAVVRRGATVALAAAVLTMAVAPAGALGSAAPTGVPEPGPRSVVECQAFLERGHGAVVRLVYLQLLGRCPDPDGYAYWVSRLAGGASTGAFAAAISDTDEAQGLMVARAYEMMLGRGPDAGGRAFWTARLQNGLTYDRLLAALAGEDEFWAQAGATSTGFVDRLYRRVLQREPDPVGLEYWADQLEAGRSRGDVAGMFTTQLEPRERLVNTAYLTILGRLPTTAEGGAAVEQLGATGNLAGVYAGIIATPEFRSHAQTFPSITT